LIEGKEFFPLNNLQKKLFLVILYQIKVKINIFDAFFFKTLWHLARENKTLRWKWGILMKLGINE